MKYSMIAELILSDAFELFGQPKWTFGKNTCNTYEVFAEKVLLPDGEKIPAWPVMELIEKDEGLSLLYSRWFLKKAIASAADIGAKTNSHVTLSINLLPAFAAEEGFVQEVLAVLEGCGLPAEKLQFELSEAQNLCAKGIENQDQFEFFEEPDCFKGQGFLIDKPMPLAELTDDIDQFAVRIGHE